MFQGANMEHAQVNVFVESGAKVVYQEVYGNTKDSRQTYTDEQVAKALSNIVGKGKPIDAKKKWAGAIWLLQWVCNYPSNTKQACERIKSLPMEAPLDYECDYRNVRELTTLSFLNEDARQIDNVRYSKNDEGAFMEMKRVVVALDEELRKTIDFKACATM